MEYVIDNNRIKARINDCFDIVKTLQCGQIFRYRDSGSAYRVYSLDKFADLYTTTTDIVIESEDIGYFIKFFDLDTDYRSIVSQLRGNGEFMDCALDFGKGIRILRQDPLETLISFIISANNNIKRISNSIEQLCCLIGEKKGNNDYAFPTLGALRTLGVYDFEDIGCGYRAPYLVDTIAKLNLNDLNNLYELTTTDAKRYLMTFTGVGPKVADCVLLFAYKKTDCFPTDTWIKKSFSYLFDLKGASLRSSPISGEAISTRLSQHFGELSGYAQQYVFYYARQKKLSKSIDKSTNIK